MLVTMDIQFLVTYYANDTSLHPTIILPRIIP
jgi:hypothetical protein